MIEEKTVTMQTIQAADIICNKCGESTMCSMGNFECISAVAHWGYCSGKDMEIHRFDLCEKCYDQLAETFQIPATVEGLD
jgi:hypothetical protein